MNNCVTFCIITGMVLPTSKPNSPRKWFPALRRSDEAIFWQFFYLTLFIRCAYGRISPLRLHHLCNDRTKMQIESIAALSFTWPRFSWRRTSSIVLPFLQIASRLFPRFKSSHGAVRDSNKKRSRFLHRASRSCTQLLHTSRSICCVSQHPAASCITYTSLHRTSAFPRKARNCVCLSSITLFCMSVSCA